MLSQYQVLKNSHFDIYHSNEGDIARNALLALNRAFEFCKQYFSLESFPKIRVVFVCNRNEFDRLVRDLLNVEIEVPSNPARIAQTQRLDMVLLSPTAYVQHSTFTFESPSFDRLLFHELIHIVEEYLSPNIEEIPNWWSEGLAIYLSEQWRFDDLFRKPAIDGIRQNKIPYLSEILSDRRLAYDWGWTIVSYIELLFGQSMIKEIITHCADGNVIDMVDIDINEFENGWKNYLKTLNT
jgi:hypothetical protein